MFLVLKLVLVPFIIHSSAFRRLSHTFNFSGSNSGLFGPKSDEIIRGWRELHNEELHNLYCSPNIIRMFKSKRVIWAKNITRIGEKRNA
jgi:hypothetical protein